MFLAFSPRLFVSYSRLDQASVRPVVGELQSRGFRVFLDTSDMDPGVNFVTKLSRELRRSTAVVAVISENYSVGRWGQAELYHAIAMGKMVIPILISRGGLSGLDEPLQRLLQDIQFVDATGGAIDETAGAWFANMLANARWKHLRDALKRFVQLILGPATLLLLVWWGMSYWGDVRKNRTREAVLSEVTKVKTVLSGKRIAVLAALVPEDREVFEKILALSQDPSQSDTARFNAMALGSELLRRERPWRWYVKDLNVVGISLENLSLVNTSFIGGTWEDLEIRDSTFAGTYWTKDRSKNKDLILSGAIFRNVDFFGGEIDEIVATDVAFINTKFRGAVIDTTNFNRVRFVTTERHGDDGIPIITPYFTSIERGVVISRRSPPAKGALDLTRTCDDVVFDGVVFTDCRLEGWFRPEWFRNSSFERCELPESLSRESLEQAGNTVTE